MSDEGEGFAAEELSESALVSVIIPAYNAEKFIARTLRSVLNQTYRRLEVIVVDDGSIDGTAEIVRRMMKADRRLTLYQQSNAGVAAARNYGIEKSTGAFIAPIDADDLWHETNIDKQVQLFATDDESLGMVYAWSINIDELDYPIGSVKAPPHYGYVYPVMMHYNLVGSGSACVIRRSCLEVVGGYSTELLAQNAQGCEDWDIYLRIARRYRVGVVPELLVGYRITASSMSASTATMERSHALVFAPVAEQFPEAYEAVTRWTKAQAYRSVFWPLFDDRHNLWAWRVWRDAFRADPVMTLMNYSSWGILRRLAFRFVTAPTAFMQDTPECPVPLSRLTMGLTLRAAALNRRANELKLRTLLRGLFSPYLPGALLRRWRLRWLNRQVCPEQSLPRAVPTWKTTQLFLAVRSLCRQRDRRIDFGQDERQGASDEAMQVFSDLQPLKTNE